MTDFDYSSLAPGIREVVRWVHTLGFATSDSGDGKTNQAAGMDCAVDWTEPMVAIEAPSAAEGIASSERLWAAICALAGGDPPPRARVETSYSPTDGVAIVLLLGFDDGELAAARGRVACQQWEKSL